MWRFISAFWPSGIVVIVVLYATLAPNPMGDESIALFPHYDKLVHALMMGGLTGAIGFDLRRSGRVSPLTTSIMWRVVIGVVIFSAADEWLQDTVTGDRSGDWLDLVADIAGCAVALWTAPPIINAIFKTREAGDRKTNS